MQARIRLPLALPLIILTMSGCHFPQTHDTSAGSTVESADSDDKDVRTRNLVVRKTKDLLMTQFYYHLRGDSVGVWHKTSIFDSLLDYYTYDNALEEQPGVQTFAHDLYTTMYGRIRDRSRSDADFYPPYANDYMDESLLWGIVWAKAYSLTNEPGYLKVARDLFHYVERVGRTSACSKRGWSPLRWGPNLDSEYRDFVNAITNEFYMALAMKLYLITKEDDYRAKAASTWEWFTESGLITQDHLIVDGLRADCTPLNNDTWTYNQGVVIGALADLYGATREARYLDHAYELASQAFGLLHAPGSKVLREIRQDPDVQKRDGDLFKGIFMRNIVYLSWKSPSGYDRQGIDPYIHESAKAAWLNRNSSGSFGFNWDEKNTDDAIVPTLLASGFDALRSVPALDLGLAYQPEVCLYDRVSWEINPDAPPALQACMPGTTKVYPNTWPAISALRVFPGAAITLYFEDGAKPECHAGGDQGKFVAWLGEKKATSIRWFKIAPHCS